MSKFKQIIAGLVVCLSCTSLVLADDTDIYLNPSVAAGAEPLVMFTLDYRPNLTSTVCSGTECDTLIAEGYLPAHLLGNMWAQSWGNIYDLIDVPQGRGVDVTRLLEAKNVDAVEMVRYGERFFTSLGFDALPETFWKRSLFLKPRDREVVCHASAWDVDAVDDLRIKMCIEINGEDFVTVHHELGHNFNSPHTQDYCGLGGLSSPVDLCYNSNASCGSALGLPGVGSLSGGSTSQQPGTIMSYCHLLGGGMSNVSLTLGRDHVYGVGAYRVPDRMISHVSSRPSSCVAVVDPESPKPISAR